MREAVEGKVSPLKELEGLRDDKLVKKTYKVGEQELTVDALSNCCLNRIACKYIM